MEIVDLSEIYAFFTLCSHF